MLRFKTYSENVRWAMREHPDFQPEGMNIRQLSSISGISYEHIRKIFKGIAAAGQDANEFICEILALPVEDMWKLAQQEKIAKKLGYRPPRMVDPIGQEMQELWKELDQGQRRMLVQLAQGLMATQHQANV